MYFEIVFFQIIIRKLWIIELFLYMNNGLITLQMAKTHKHIVC